MCINAMVELNALKVAVAGDFPNKPSTEFGVKLMQQFVRDELKERYLGVAQVEKFVKMFGELRDFLDRYAIPPKGDELEDDILFQTKVLDPIHRCKIDDELAKITSKA